MEHSLLSATAEALVLTFSAPAMSTIASDLYEDVQSAAGHDSSVLVEVEGDTVILTGYVRDVDALQAIERSAEMNGANVVVNRVLHVS